LSEEAQVYRQRCSKCGVRISFKSSMLGKLKPCPKCGEMLLLTTDSQPDSSPENATKSAPAFAPPPLSLEAAPTTSVALPQRMKANKVIAGKTCSCCSQVIELGDEIYNCPSCGESMHFTCYTQRGSCGNGNCSRYATAVINETQCEEKPKKAIPTGAATKECPHCGETILKSAKKCKFCMEILDPSLKRNKEKSTSDVDDNLSTLEIVFAVLCGGIACIVGLVWVCMGKKKGWKLMAISIVAQICWGLFSALVNHK
jgi:predicted RNA-binding Zn-ribbon protein involved in translation (DUF1610 family)